MSVDLNLLPQDFQISKSTAKALKTIKALSVIFTVVFITFCLGIGGFFVYSKITINNTQTEVDQLKLQVKTQEKSEQELVLLKDRLDKINSIKFPSNTSSNISNMESLLANLSPGFDIDEVSINQNKMNLAVSIYSNEDLTFFMENLKNSDVFSTVNLTSLNYSSGGYAINANFSSLENKQ